jgi:O-antigen/teichoic acid export membrane protein
LTAPSQNPFSKASLATFDTSWQPVTRPVGLLWLSLAFGAGLNGLSQLILVRHLDPASYGSIAAAFSAASVVTPLASLGLGGHILQRFGQEGQAARRWLFPSALCLVFSSLAAALILAGWSLIANADARITQLTLLLIPWCIMQGSSGFLQALYQVEGLYPGLAAWQLAPSAGRLAAALAAFLANKSASFVAGATSLAAAAIILGQTVAFRRFTQLGKVPTNEAASTTERPSLWSVLLGSWPYAAGGSLFLIYYQSDIFILAWLKGPRASAPYAAASLVLTFIYHFPAAVHQQYLAPKLNRWAWHDRNRLQSVQRLALTLVTAFGIVIAVAVATTAPWAASKLFGPAYQEAGFLLRWLAVGIPLRYLSVGLGSGLITPRQARLRVVCQGLTAAVNVSMNLFLIPRFGALAAVASTITSETVLLFTYFWALKAAR